MPLVHYDSYTPTNWQTGDIITAEKLNHAEQGIADASNGGGIVYTLTTSEAHQEVVIATCNKTYDEVVSLVNAGNALPALAVIDQMGSILLNRVDTTQMQTDCVSFFTAIIMDVDSFLEYEIAHSSKGIDVLPHSYPA